MGLLAVAACVCELHVCAFGLVRVCDPLRRPRVPEVLLLLCTRACACWVPAAALGRALGRPAFFTQPAPVLRALFGEMGEETMLASLRVQPARLITAGFRFSHPDVETALRAALV